MRWEVTSSPIPRWAPKCKEHLGQGLSVRLQRCVCLPKFRQRNAHENGGDRKDAAAGASSIPSEIVSVSPFPRGRHSLRRKGNTTIQSNPANGSRSRCRHWSNWVKIQYEPQVSAPRIPYTNIRDGGIEELPWALPSWCCTWQLYLHASTGFRLLRVRGACASRALA